jgi:hypothetical protein
LREFEKGRKQVSEKYVGFLAPASDRYEAWIEVLGSNEAPLTSPYPMTASAPGIAQGAFYSLDIAALSVVQRTRLIAYLARRFELPEEEVARDLDTIGCPIVAEHVSVTIIYSTRSV